MSAAARQSTVDVRLRRPRWNPIPKGMPVRRRVRIAAMFGGPFIVFYLYWLLDPVRIGNPVLYGMLLFAELLNVVQAIGFWWTCAYERIREPKAPTRPVAVDVLIPRYDEPLEVVELPVAAAAGLRGSDVRVWLLDDGESEEMRALAERHGVGYITRPVHDHAKAGNINHALALVDAPYVAIVDCDHVVSPDFLEATLGHFEEDERLAFIQTPQYYANGYQGGVAGAAWHQQTLFFGAIARGKDGLGATFCCGTNVVFRRAALDEVDGFPTHSITEDFALSITLHERGWHTAYLPKVLASGLGPETMSAYTTQQLRWARGCLASIPQILTARLPWRLRAQYLLSGLYWLSGWTVLFYMAFPAMRLLFGIQPLAHLTAPIFLLHFSPYFLLALSTAALAGSGSYTFTALALASASFWVFIVASLLTVARRRGSFKVTPKTAGEGREPGAVIPGLAAIVFLAGVSIYGLISSRSSATYNNVAFALFHISILLTGCWPALRRPPAAQSGSAGPAALSAAPALAPGQIPAGAGPVSSVAHGEVRLP
jgi:cellulose synthase (UDP-forming)